MKSEKEYKLFIKMPDSWQQISETGDIRTCELTYKGFNAFRMDEKKDAGVWKRKKWYRITPAGITVDMSMHEFIECLKKVDREENRK